jgi:PAS domain S-box-containing protein
MSDLTPGSPPAQSGETLFDHLLAQVPGQLFQLYRGPDGRSELRYASYHSRDVFGVDHQTLMREGAAALLRVHPDDLSGLRAAMAEAEAHGTHWHHEYRIFFPDGSMHWVETRAQVQRFPDGSTLTHGFSVNADAAKAAAQALQASEERFRRAADAAGLGVATVDMHSQLMQFDLQACRNHGLAFPHPPFSLTDWQNQIHPDDRASAQATLAQALKNNQTAEGRYRFIQADGRMRWLEILVRAEPDTRGEVTSLIGTCRDVTDAQEAARLRDEKAAAERANRAKSQFLSRVSHELRTPLNAVLGFAQLMEFDQQSPLPSEQLARLQRVQQAGRHLLALINDMLDLARIEQEDFSLQPEALSVDAVLGTCAELIQPLAASSGIVLSPAQRTGLWVRADARTLQQVLMNLLSNAIKYNRDGGRVWLGVRAVPDPGAASDAAAWVRIEVHDSGIGLSEADQRRLFQPFARLGSDPHRIEGSGLGLVIARQLADAMGGQLQVSSQLGQGSCFSIILPGTFAPDQPTEKLMPTPTTPAQSTTERQVLYIEDQPLNVMLMEELFRSEPHWRLHIATDGASALEMLQTLRPDLMLIDMHLPDTDGHQLLQAIKARSEGGKPVAPCIALSADAMPEQIALARESGFDDYWTKPIDVAVVLTQLHRWLHG